MNLWELLSNPGERLDSIGRMHGVACGVVTDNRDPEGRGRLRISFSWIGEGVESGWVRSVSLMAGKERGAWFLPEVGDEVLVAFEHGDINYPYVLGALWNAEEPPPEQNRDGKNNIRKFTSRSGHEIVFCDDAESGKEKIEIQTKGGQRIVLDDSRGAEKIVVADRSGSNSISIDSKGQVVIESQATLKIRSQVIQIEGGSVVEIKGALVKIN